MKLFFACIFLMIVQYGYGQSSVDILAYIENYKQIALEEERLNGIPAPITLAQGILESGAGKSKLAKDANNHFGVKVPGNPAWMGKIYYAWDDEKKKSEFRWYNSALDSYKDHSLFLKNNGRYNSLFLKSIFDYRGWANGLQQAGYATSPTYAKALIGYIDAYKLYAINGGVKLPPGKTITITKTITIEELVELEDVQLAENEKSEEEECIQNAIQHYGIVVEINDVNCTILYPGESLSSISMKYNISQSELLKFNEAYSENSFKEGDIVFLEKKKKKYYGAQDYYHVQEGETLYQISQKFGIRITNLTKLNNLTLYSVLSEGQKIKLK